MRPMGGPVFEGPLVHEVEAALVAVEEGEFGLGGEFGEGGVAVNGNLQ